MFTRLEFEWTHPHPPLALLDPAFLWLPTGEDNTGLNDRHWIANRHDAEGVTSQPLAARSSSRLHAPALAPALAPAPAHRTRAFPLAIPAPTPRPTPNPTPNLSPTLT